jgi:hypothetical protein
VSSAEHEVRIESDEHPGQYGRNQPMYRAACSCGWAYKDWRWDPAEAQEDASTHLEAVLEPTMTKWRVTVDRTERIEFELKAVDRYDAEARFLQDGNEVGSKTMKIDVIGTEEVKK